MFLTLMEIFIVYKIGSNFEAKRHLVWIIFVKIFKGLSATQTNLNYYRRHWFFTAVKTSLSQSKSYYISEFLP